MLFIGTLKWVIFVIIWWQYWWAYRLKISIWYPLVIDFDGIYTEILVTYRWLIPQWLILIFFPLLTTRWCNSIVIACFFGFISDGQKYDCAIPTLQVGRIKQKRGYKDQWPYNIKIYTDEEGKNKGDAVLSYEDPSAAHSAGGFFNSTCPIFLVN